MCRRAHILKVLAVIAFAIGCAHAPLAAQTSRSPVAPRREFVQSVAQEAYDKFKSDTRGKNADYIPFLAQVDSKLFGIAIA